MDIILKNCNNIDKGKIYLKENSLNIKYAINGTGKSTIARAIVNCVQDVKNSTNTLSELKPFKYLDTNENEPIINGCEEIKSVKVFNESYINEYVFRPDELLKGSFDIFIQDEHYLKGLKEIDQLVIDIKRMFSENKDIDELINDFNELSGSFGRSTKSGIHGSSNMAKAFKNGNKVENVPEDLSDYKHYIQHEENYKWLKWQFEGKNFIDITENCPYCVVNIQSKKQKIMKISEVYDSKSVQNLNAIVDTFNRLNAYFSDSTKQIISNFIKNIDGYNDEQVEFLREVKDQIDRLNQKFNKIKVLSFNSLKDVDKIIEELKLYKIDLNLYSHLNSENTRKKELIVNASLDSIIDKAGLLQGRINKQKKYVKELVERNKKDINSFLMNAGYPYNVDLIENNEGQHQLKLIHNDISGEIKNAKNHLSYGERNAFALVLFMYDTLKVQPDLIILDDPISSFDKNKKYAIIEMLFRKSNSFKDRLVLLLTHDFEPIIDMIHHHRDRFSIPFVSFIENNDGNLTEKEIKRRDIRTFMEITLLNIEKSSDIINKIVYLRRFFEITNNKSMGYQLLSSLLHKRYRPTVQEIMKIIPDFNYDLTVARINNDSELIKLYYAADNNYEKLHIYRIIFDDKEQNVDSDIIAKFINQAFHMENDYIYQLDPRKYQMVPHYVISECDRLVESINDGSQLSEIG